MPSLLYELKESECLKQKFSRGFAKIKMVYNICIQMSYRK